MVAGLLVLARLAMPGGMAWGQTPGRLELGAQVVAVTAPRGAIVAGPRVAWWAGRRDRLVVLGGAGLEGGGAAGRLEALWHFHLAPQALRRAGIYVGAGVGAAIGAETRGVVIATLGLDTNPAGPAGWLVEVGLGGGVRLSGGGRWRWRPRRDRGRKAKKPPRGGPNAPRANVRTACRPAGAERPAGRTAHPAPGSPAAAPR